MKYEVRCPSDPYENTSYDHFSKAVRYCHNLSDQYGYAEITTWENGFQQLVYESHA